MNVRHSRLARLVALTVVVTMPLLGLAGVASAANPRGSAKWCANHPGKASKPVCANSGAAGGGSGSSGGTGGAPVDITVTVSPNPLVETGQSEVHAVIEVETLPSFAGDAVTISSSQLNASCFNVFYTSVAEFLNGKASLGGITVTLDDDGNATVEVDASNCAPGTSVIEADLDNAPYLTALTQLVANPPVVTPAGLTGYPNFEVETGDTTGGTNPSGNSDVYAVFYVEDSPVYAEQPVEISSAQLEARCGDGWLWYSGNGGTGAGTGPGVNNGPLATTTLDDDGNAVFIFQGQSCAAGDSQVIADVIAGTHDTFTFDYTIDPPAPTI